MWGERRRQTFRDVKASLSTNNCIRPPCWGLETPRTSSYCRDRRLSPSQDSVSPVPAFLPSPPIKGTVMAAVTPSLGMVV